MRWGRRLTGAAAAAGLACAGLAATAVPAAAAACSGTTGVTVVIDTGSSVSTRCAGGDPPSALSALSAVASVTQVQTQPGFVCRIDGYPSDDPCVRTPPASAYWAFFHAPRGGTWTYSSQGAGSYDPPAGSVIGFRFGSGQAPRVAPPAATTTSAPTTATKTSGTSSTPAPTARSTSRPAPTGGGTASTTAGSASSTRSTSSSSTPSSSASPSGTPTASDTATGAPSPGASDSPSPLAAQPTAESGSGGTGTLLAAVGLLVLLGAGVGWFAWRRRSVG